MLQREFQERVGMEVSVDEYSAIEVIYMNSDLEKDDFCKMWKRINQSRIKEYRRQQKLKEEEGVLRDKLYNIYHKTIGLSWDKYNLTMQEYFSKVEMRLLESIGYSKRDRISTVGYQLAKYLGI